MQPVARHTLYNILGQALPLAVGLVAIPILTRSLGDTRFGLLALMWAIIGYFSLLDLGLGRATTKFVAEDRKSTRLNSSHANISYAVFCLKKKKTNNLVINR